MPDGDVIYQKLVPCWRRPYRLMKGGSDTLVLGSAVVKAAAKNLRVGRGAPGLAAVAAVVDEVGSGVKSAPHAMADLRSVERNQRGHVHTRLLVEVAGQLIADLEAGHATPSSTQLEISERFCERLVRHQLLSRALPALIGSRFASHADADAFQKQLIEVVRPALRKEAAMLLARPTGAGIRAPSITGVRRPTAETLYEPITL